ncbi:6-phosphogluconolactonase [candidate division KSB1 bacterium]|nr:6-phosphogluconolactonase [candidate division KSB1 bacterium]
MTADSRQIVFCETPDDVADAAADLIFESQTEAVAERGVFRVALSGGTTPGLLFARLTTEEWRDEMAWENWEVFWSDERCVPPDSPDSNFAIAKRLLLDRMPIGEVFRIRGEIDPREAAAEYARTLRARLDPGPPVFDVILLGMGADGHTASLFPGQPALESASLIEAVEVDQPVRHRITFTLNLINRARRVIFLVCGEAKAQRVHEIIHENRVQLPAARVDPAPGECLWLLDHAAARKIR